MSHALLILHFLMTLTLPVADAKLVLAVALRPPELTNCERLLGPELQPTVAQTRAAREVNFSKKTLLEYVNFLSGRRFRVTAVSLTRESATVQSLLLEKFNVALAGNVLYKRLREEFESIDEAVAATVEGRKLNAFVVQAESKKWDATTLTQLAKDLEARRAPFMRTFLADNSSLVGMLLAEKYGYPVCGIPILHRIEAAGLSVAEIRRRAGFGHDSPHRRRLQELNEVNWDATLVTEILTLLKDHGYVLIERDLNLHKDKIEELIWQELAIRTNVAEIKAKVFEFFKGWPAAKETVGVSYENRRKDVRGNPGWNQPLLKRILQFAKEKGYDQLSTSFLRDPARFAPLRELLKEEFKFEISGRTILNYADLFHGGLRAACLDASVPYFNEVTNQMPTEWTDWNQNKSAEQMSPIALTEILQLIEAHNFDPTPSLLGDEKKFAPLAEVIHEQLGVKVTGEQVLRNAKRMFKSLAQALAIANVSSNNLEPWSAEIIERATAMVYREFPKITVAQMRIEHSERIGEILRDEMGFVTSGYALSEQIKSAGGMESIGPKAKAVVRKDSAWPRGGNPSRDLYKQVLTFMNSLGYFPSDSLLISQERFAPVAAAVEKQFKIKISGRAVSDSGKALFGSLRAAREAIGLPPREELKLTRAEISFALKELLSAFPELTIAILKERGEIGEFLSAQLKMKISGRVFYEQVQEEFGSLPRAVEESGIESRWSRVFPPNKARLVAMLKFIGDSGFTPIDGYLFRDKNKFAPVAKAIQAKYGYDIPGQSIYSYAFKLFGPFRGLKLAVKEAGYGPVEQAVLPPPRWKAGECPDKELYLEVLRYISAKGFYPGRALVQSLKDFAPVRTLIEQHFGFSIPGNTIIKCGAELFGDYAKGALPAAGISSRKGVPLWGPDFVKEALKVVLDVYPDITASEMYDSTKILPLLQERLKVQASGATLIEKIREYFVDLPGARLAIGREEFWPERGLPTAENYLKLLRFLDDEGFDISWSFFQDEAAFKKAAVAVEKKFNVKITMSTLYRRGLDLFGTMEKAKERAGIKDRSPQILSVLESQEKDPEKAKDYYRKILRFLDGQNFKLEPEFFKDKEKFAAAIPLIEKEFHLLAAGNPMYQRMLDLHKTFAAAMEDAGLVYREHLPDWTPDFALQALAVVLEAYPNIKFNELMLSHSAAIGLLLKQKLGVDEASGVTLGKHLVKIYGSLYEAELKLGYLTPWMFATVKSPDLDRAQAVKALKTLRSLGIEPSTKILQKYSYQVGLVLLMKNDLLMTGAALYARINGSLFTTGGLEEALAEIDTKPVGPSTKPHQLKEILEYLEDFGINLDDESVVQNSKSIAWLSLFQFGAALNGEDLLKECERHYGSIARALGRAPKRGNPAQLLALNPTSTAILGFLFEAAGLKLNDAEAVKTHGLQIQNIVHYHFGKNVDLKKLAAKIGRDGLIDAGSPNIPRSRWLR